MKHSELIFLVAGTVIILVISTYLITLMETPNFLVLCGIVFVQVFIFMLLYIGLFGEKIPDDTCPNCLRKYNSQKEKHEKNKQN